MIKKIKELTCKALVLSMLASTVLPGFSGSAYGAYGEKAAADSEKTEYVLSEIERLLKGSAPYFGGSYSPFFFIHLCRLSYYC